MTDTSQDSALEPNLKEAAKFLRYLDSATEKFTFQTFDDRGKGKDKDRTLARILHGTLKEHASTLIDLNQRGAGIFVSVNETDGAGRESEHPPCPRSTA